MESNPAAELRPRGPTRCPYCHDALDTASPTTCSNCAAAHHAECFQELGKCASCGQGAVREFVIYRAPPEEETPIGRFLIRLLVRYGLPFVILMALSKTFPCLGFVAIVFVTVGFMALVNRARHGRLG